jgi:hypothetical protein
LDIYVANSSRNVVDSAGSSRLYLGMGDVEQFHQVFGKTANILLSSLNKLSLPVGFS